MAGISTGSDGSVTISTELDDSGAKKGFEDLNKETEKFSKKTSEESEKARKSLDSMNKQANIVKGGMIALGTTIVGIGTASAVAGSEFETSLAKLSTIADTNVVSMDDFSKALKGLSNQTGVSASDLANVAYNAISAGTSTEEAMTMVEQATKLAKGGFTDAESALSVLTTAMNAYGDSAGTAEEISDSLVTVQNLGVTTVGELSSVIGRAIATGSAYGVSLGNVESAYVSMTKQGIASAEATTYMSGMFNELGDSGSSVGKILQENTGKSFGELMADGNSLGDVLSILSESVDGNSEAFINLWGSAEAGKGANAIVNEGLEQFNTNLEAISNSAGATESAYSTMNDTMQSKMEQLKQKGINALIEGFGSIEPVLSRVIDLVTTYLIPAFSVLINNLPVLSVILGGLAIAYTVLKVQMLAATLAEEGMTIAQYALNVAMSLNPMALIILAITALVAAFVYLWNNCEEFRNFWIGLWDSIISFATTAIDAIVNFFTNTIPNAIVSFIEKAARFFIWWQTLPVKIALYIAQALVKVVEFVADLASKGIEAAKGFIEKITSGFSGLPSRMADIGLNLIKGLWNGINNAKNWILGKISGFVDGIIGGIKSFFGIHSPSVIMREEVGQYLAKGIYVGFDKYNPMEQIEDSLRLGMGSIDTMLNLQMPSAQSGYNGYSQTINFNQSMQSPDEIARTLRLQNTYGMAGAY